MYTGLPLSLLSWASVVVAMCNCLITEDYKHCIAIQGTALDYISGLFLGVWYDSIFGVFVRFRSCFRTPSLTLFGIKLERELKISGSIPVQ